MLVTDFCSDIEQLSYLMDSLIREHFLQLQLMQWIPEIDSFPYVQILSVFDSILWNLGAVLYMDSNSSWANVCYVNNSQQIQHCHYCRNLLMSNFSHPSKLDAVGVEISIVCDTLCCCSEIFKVSQSRFGVKADRFSCFVSWLRCFTMGFSRCSQYSSLWFLALAAVSWSENEEIALLNWYLSASYCSS